MTKTEQSQQKLKSLREEIAKGWDGPLSSKSVTNIIETRAEETPDTHTPNINELAEKYFGKNDGVDLDLPSRASKRGSL